jgi:hypothetical protein
MKLSKYGKYKKEEFTEFDQYLYRQLYILIDSKSERLAAYLPEFIIYESLTYFLEKKSFEEYNTIKGYLLLNPKKMIQITRNEWMSFGWKTIFGSKKDETKI